ncbi:MAG: J domain-containing protein [Acidimicrobiia bacterium]
MPGIPTHYEVLGVPPDAPLPDIRASYRARARLHHPDRLAASGQTPVVSMAEINEAYRVLSDPGRRAVYDRTLGRPTAPDPTPASDFDDEPVVRPRPNRLSPDGPARFPWKAMLLLGAIGSALVLVSAAFTEPPSEEPPDGIIRIDSCVTIEANGDAREIACTGEDDIVVELFIPGDARCPAGLLPHRDRLGLGVACIAP